MPDSRFTAAAPRRHEAMDHLAQAWDAQGIIDLLDDAATELLRVHGFDSWPRLVPAPEHIQAATGYPLFPVYSLPERAAEEAQRAARLLEVLRLVRAFLYSSGSLNDAVILGVRLGVAVEEAGLADLVPLGKRAVRLTTEVCEQVPPVRPPDSGSPQSTKG